MDFPTVSVNEIDVNAVTKGVGGVGVGVRECN